MVNIWRIAHTSIDAHISVYQISVDKTVINDMDNITKSRNVHKNHTFLSILLKVTSRGEEFTLPRWLQLYVGNIYNLCNTKVVTESEMQVYPLGCLPPTPLWEGLGRAKYFDSKFQH